MNNISKDILTAIHEGKWLSIEYRNKQNTLTKYWIGINNIHVDSKSLEVTGLHLRTHETKELKVFVDGICCSSVLDGTYHTTNKTLLDDILYNPKKYGFIFHNVANLKVLTYLADCSKLDNQPSLNNEYSLIKALDNDTLQNGKISLSNSAFKQFVSKFQEKVNSKKGNKPNLIEQLCFNLLSIYTPKGLYVLAYKEVRFDVANRLLTTDGTIQISTEFTLNGKKQSIGKFIDAEDRQLLDDFEKNEKQIKDIISSKNRRTYTVDDRPYFMCLQRNSIINLEKEYKSIIDMYENDCATVPIKAFFGDLHSIQDSSEDYPIALLNDKINLDQLLAIHNAMHYPVAYIQGPPGTGKTSTIVNTISTSFFNGLSVLFSSYNNHPIDNVLNLLQDLKYKGKTIPFPILKISRNEEIPQTIGYIKDLIERTKDISVYESTLLKNKETKAERTKKLIALLRKHEESVRLHERKEAIESLLEKNENITLRMNVEGQQLSAIQKRLNEIGTISDEDAISLLQDDIDDFMKYIYFTSAKYIQCLLKPEFEDFLQILSMEDSDKQKSAFNGYISSDENIKKLIQVFPIMATTCLSAHKIGEPKQYFDMTIIDEASQCNTAVSLIPVIRSKKLMLVGDPQQLNPVITLDKAVNAELKKKYSITSNYDYITNSIYKTYLANDPVSEETLLHNHYRCAKEIIEFSNKKYYNNKLSIGKKSCYDKPLLFCDVKGSAISGKNTSLQEADEVVRYVKENYSKSIGVITPFKNQKELIEDRFKSEGLSGVSCGTVHAFQGDEKDIILFSLALTDKTHQSSYEWLKNNKELINVAVSRAKEQFVMVASKKDIKRLHKENDKDDDIYELAEYVQTNGVSEVSQKPVSSRALGIKPYSTETENVFLTTLNHALSNLLSGNKKYKVKREVQISHVFEKNEFEPDLFYTGSFDFVIYEQLARKKELPVFAIELDGREHFEDDRVKKRDEKKKQICKNHGFTLMHVENSYARRYNFIKEILTEYFKG